MKQILYRYSVVIHPGGDAGVAYRSGMAISDAVLAGKTENARADAEHVPEGKLSG